MCSLALQVDAEVVVDGLMSGLCAEDRQIVSVVTDLLEFVTPVAEVICGDKEKSSELTIFEALSHSACQSCYKREWYNKSGGCIAIRHLVDTLPKSWVLRHQLEFHKVCCA